MTNMMNLMPELTGEELSGVEVMARDMSEEELSMFAASYRAQRKDPNTVLLPTILGFIAAAEIQRFYLGQLGMGFLFLLTGGLCLIGTIIDVINNKKLTTEHNLGIAREIATRV